MVMLMMSMTSDGVSMNYVEYPVQGVGIVAIDRETGAPRDIQEHTGAPIQRQGHTDTDRDTEADTDVNIDC